MNLGRLFVNIGADTRDLKRGVSEAKSDLTGLGATARREINDGVGGAFKSLASAISPARIALAAVAGAAGFGYLTHKAMESADALAKTADRLGTLPGKMAGLQLQSKLVGVEFGAVEKAMGKTAMRVSEAAQGVGEAQAIFKALNLDARELAQLSPDQQFMRIGAAINNLGNVGDRNRAALKLFEEQGGAMLNLFAEGAEGIDKATAAAAAFGTGISRVDAAKIEAANDAFTMVQEAMSGFFTSVAIEVAPILEAVATKIADVARNSDGFRGIIRTAFDWIVRGAGFVLDAFHYIHIALKAGELGFKVLAAGAVTAFEWITQALVDETNRWLSMFNGVIDGLNAVMGTKFARAALFINPVSAAAQGLRDSVVQTALEIDKMAGDPPPSAKLRAFIDEIRNSAQASAEAHVAARQQIVQTGELIDTKAEEERAKRLEQLRQQLEETRQFTLSEEQVEVEAHARRQEVLQNALNSRLITEARYADLSVRIADKHNAKLRELETRNYNALQQLWVQGQVGRMQIAADGFSNLATLMNTQSRSMFEVGKAAALAEIAIRTPMAAFEAYTSLAGFGPAGMAAGAILAATIVAKGANAAANIASQQFGGKGTASSGSFAGGAVPTAAVSTTPLRPEPVAANPGVAAGVTSAATSAATGSTSPNVTIVLEGKNYSREEVIALIDQINEVTRDGAKLEAA